MAPCYRWVGMEVYDPHVISPDVLEGRLYQRQVGMKVLGLHSIFSDTSPAAVVRGALLQPGKNGSPGSPFSIC